PAIIARSWRVRLAGVSCRQCSKWRDGHGQEAIQARCQEVGRAKERAQGTRGLYGTRRAAEGSDQRLGGRSRRRRPTERRSSPPKTRSGFAGSAVPDPDRQPVLCAGGETASARNRGVSLLGGGRSVAPRLRFLGCIGPGDIVGGGRDPARGPRF